VGKYIQKIGFVIRSRYVRGIAGFFRKLRYTALGMEIGSKTVLPKLHTTWPNQVKIGNRCQFENDIVFKYDGTWKPGKSIIIGDNVFIGTKAEFNIRISISVGSNSLIASGCRFIDHDHGSKLGELIRTQAGPEKKIVLGEDVWLGCNVVVLKGVTIGNGAIVAAGAIVNKNIPAYEIWGGVPAKKLGERNQ